VGLSRKHIFDAVDKSVERLGTYIDVLQIHRLDRETPRHEIMKALNDVVESGKVRYIGASSMAAWEFQTLQNIAERNGWHKFISMQNYYNLIYREEEREMVRLSSLMFVGDGLLIVCLTDPLLSGHRRRPHSLVTSRSWRSHAPLERSLHQACRYVLPLPHTHMHLHPLSIPYLHPLTLFLHLGTDKFLAMLVHGREDKIDQAIISRVEEVAKKHNVSMATIATAWCVKKGVMPIIGLSSKERIDQAVENVRFKLSDEDAGYLEEMYVPKVRQGF
jgi:aryl-alcohol dehydrogenase-like predicted oxidoreductase